MDNFLENNNSLSFTSFMDKSLFGFAKLIVTEKIYFECINDYLLKLLEYSKDEIFYLVNTDSSKIITSPNMNVLYDEITVQLNKENSFKIKICLTSKSNKKLLFLVKGISKIENGCLTIYMILTNETKAIDHIDTLERRANHDSLTGLFNRGTTKNMIENYISSFDENTTSAFIILDIDNFKKTNDTYGHLQGDALLIDLADSINKVACKSSINGRYGGDEFIIFLEDIPYKEFASGQIQKILELTTNATAKKLENDYVTFSAGISYLPYDALSFDNLFKIADAALYFAKAEGKNVIVSSDELSRKDKVFKCSNNREHNNHVINETGNQFVEYSFNLLYHSENLHSAINLLFSVLGRQFNFNEISIFENNIKTKLAKNTNGWHSNEIKNHAENLDDIPIKFCHEYLYKSNTENYELKFIKIDELDNNLQELLRIHDINHMLAYPLTDENDDIYGFIGFFNFEKNYDLNVYQKTVLKEISNVINSFLMKEILEKEIFELRSKLGEVNENSKHII